MSCDNVCSYKGWGNCIYPTVYSCPNPSYPTRSGNACLPLATVPAPTPAVASYACNGSCNNAVALGCTSGSPITDGAQVACGTTHTWNCSGQGVGSVNSVQCSKANAACAPVAGFWSFPYTFPYGTFPLRGYGIYNNITNLFTGEIMTM